jgi:hypothetical protein
MTEYVPLYGTILLPVGSSIELPDHVDGPVAVHEVAPLTSHDNEADPTVYSGPENEFILRNGLWLPPKSRLTFGVCATFMSIDPCADWLLPVFQQVTVYLTHPDILAKGPAV